MLKKKLNFKKIKTKKIFSKIFNLWFKYYRLLFLLALIGISIWGVFFWNKYIYSYSWSDAQKQEYLLSKEKRFEFDEEKFNNVLGKIEKRQDFFGNNLKNQNDIFKKY